MYVGKERDLTCCRIWLLVLGFLLLLGFSSCQLLGFAILIPVPLVVLRTSCTPNFVSPSVHKTMSLQAFALPRYDEANKWLYKAA